jgi:hypothetical protein
MTRVDGKIIGLTEFGALIETADGSLTIRHASHGQDFHSEEGAKFEAWHLYVMTSGLNRVLQVENRCNLGILDVGMGLGYNAAATIAAWLDSPGYINIEMLSLEVDQRLVQAVASGVAPWQAGWSESWIMGPKSLVGNGNIFRAELSHPRSGRVMKWSVRLGDANQADLNALCGPIDFIWQDPFTPELNPEMWSSGWFAKMKGLANPNCVLVSYSVARVVKQALEDAGWQYERVPTPGRKRHWLKAFIAAN